MRKLEANPIPLSVMPDTLAISMAIVIKIGIDVCHEFEMKHNLLYSYQYSNYYRNRLKDLCKTINL